MRKKYLWTISRPWDMLEAKLPVIRSIPMRRCIPASIFSISFLLFLLASCATTSPVDGPAQTVDLTLSDEYYEKAELTLEEGNVYDTFIYLLKSLDRNPENEKARLLLDSLHASLVSELHFMKEPITRGRGMEHPLSYLLYYQPHEEAQPVPDMPIKFRFAEGAGVLTEDAITNDAGIAKCYVERIDSFDQGITIEAMPVIQYNGASIALDHLVQSYVYSTVSMLEQTQHVYVLFENPNQEWGSQQFAHLRSSLSRLFRENEFSNVQFHYMTEEILFNRAQALDRSSIDILTDADSLFLMRVETSFLSQQSVDFFFSSAHIVLEVVDTNSPAVTFTDEVTRRGAGKTKELSAYQAVVNAANDLARNLDLYLKEKRRIHGV